MDPNYNRMLYKVVNAMSLKPQADRFDKFH